MKNQLTKEELNLLLDFAIFMADRLNNLLNEMFKEQNFKLESQS